MNKNREFLKILVIDQMWHENCPDFVIKEFEEQYIFMSKHKLESMVKYTYEQFIAWYDEEA